MTIKVVKNEDVYNDDFLKLQSSGAGVEFLQSLIWAKIIKSEQANFNFFEAVELKEVLVRALVVFKKIPFLKKLTYAYCPRGPIFKKDLSTDTAAETFKALLSQIKKETNLVFFRFEPEISLLNNFKTTSFTLKKTINLQPQKTLLINLELTESEILKAMHQKTRYNIRLAGKKGVVVKEAIINLNDKEGAEKDFNDFWRLMKQTSKRDNFKIHDFSHYRNLILEGNNFIRLFFAEYQGQRIATAMFSFFGDKVTYLHGASSSEFKALMAPYLLQFQVIKEAKNQGFRYYDFYGIDEKKWPGVTRFKLGFGGFVYEYAGTYDLVFKPFWYYIYNLIRNIRRLI